MAEQIYNPILPLNVYIPDGEPRIFGDRLYLYGSHDRAGGTKYCELDYELWSAPVSLPRDVLYEAAGAAARRRKA